MGLLLSLLLFSSLFSFSYSAFVKADTARCSCLREAEQRLIQHYQVRPAAKWTRQGVKSLLASVCNPSACSHSTSRLLPLPQQPITYFPLNHLCGSTQEVDYCLFSLYHSCSITSSLSVSDPGVGETYCRWIGAVCFGCATLMRHLSTTHFKTEWRRIKPHRHWNESHIRWVSVVECKIKVQPPWETWNTACDVCEAGRGKLWAVGELKLWSESLH